MKPYGHFYLIYMSIGDGFEGLQNWRLDSNILYETALRNSLLARS